MEDQIYILLGSNIGNPQTNLEMACKDIQETAGAILSMSSVYKTAPWGITNQPEFYNQVIHIRSSLGPLELLKKIQSIENRMGRVREMKWGPRIIDIDILFYGQQVVHAEDLVIPHPGIPDRRFTLIPLVELKRTFNHPVLNKSMELLLEECEDHSSVEKIPL